MSVKYATEHRCGVVLRGTGLSDAVSGTDPLKDNLALQARMLLLLWVPADEGCWPGLPQDSQATVLWYQSPFCT